MMAPPHPSPSNKAYQHSNDDIDEKDNHMISLYYCYPPTSIPPDQLNHHADFHRETCGTLNLGGRIRVSEEGINGVLSGSDHNLREYEARLREELLTLVSHDDRKQSSNENEDPTAEWLDMKYCHLRKDVPVEKQLFDSLSVKITREVVSLIEPVAEHNTRGKNKGRARCRQRRKQKRKEKQRLEKLIQEDGSGETNGGGPRESNSIPSEAEQTPASLTQQMESTKIDGEDESVVPSNTRENNNELGTALPIQDWEKQTPAVHLSPQEWNEKLLQLSREKHLDQNAKDSSEITTVCPTLGEDAILLDTRNIYETRVGHFAVPNLETFFPNTRKFSSLPNALNTEEAAKALAGKQVFMYCTGGVRCERAGSYLRALSESNSGAWKDMQRPKGIYQLRGGIQKYLESYGGEQQEISKSSNEVDGIDVNHDGKVVAQGDTAICQDGDKPCLYRGKNFVFDPRRTDPVIGNGITSNGAASDSNAGHISLVGKCIICSSPHDDYDNGHAPYEDKEARCCRCRVLVLVCNSCRNQVRCWGEPQSGEVETNDQGDGSHKKDLFCGKAGGECIDEGNIAEKVETARF